MELALYGLRCRMHAEVPDGQLVRKSIKSEWTEEAYILRCRGEYIENIAVERKIEIQGIP